MYSDSDKFEVGYKTIRDLTVGNAFTFLAKIEKIVKIVKPVIYGSGLKKNRLFGSITLLKTIRVILRKTVGDDHSLCI